MSVSSQDRLKRLRELLDQLERLPPSAERERMLREVRARVVDVDTGESPRAMLPTGIESTLPPGPGTPAVRVTRAPAAAVRRPASRARPAPVRPVAPAPPAADRPADADDQAPFETADVLSLDDEPSFSPTREAHARPGAGPWTRGLRG